MLHASALPKDRKTLADKVKVNDEELINWAGMADLVRVKGIGLILAELMVASGVAGNVQGLVEAMRNPDAARNTLKAYIQENNKSSYLPSRKQLLSISEEAAELRPKLLLGTLESNNSFQKYIISREKEERSHSRRISLSIIGFLLLAIGILYGLSRVYLNNWINGKIIPGDPLNQLSVEITQIMFGVSNSSLLLIVGILFAFLISLYFIYDRISYFLDTRVVLWLFNHPGHRKFYRAIKSIDLSKQVRGIWWAVGIFAVLALVLVLYAYQLIRLDVSLDALTQRLSPLVIGGGILLGVVTSLPILRFYFKEFKEKNDHPSVQRIMIYYLSKVLSIPLMVVLLTQIAMPVSFGLHRELYLDLIAPRARQELLRKRDEIVKLEIVSPSEESRREQLLLVLDDEILAKLNSFGTVISAEDTSIVDIYIPAALNMVVWTALTAYVLLFVFPYLILDGWKRGIFYILILAISFNLENILSKYSPSWFMLKERSTSSLLMIAFFIFANALFFDWLFDVLTEKKKICPSCGTSLPKESFFCSHCGFVQE